MSDGVVDESSSPVSVSNRRYIIHGGDTVMFRLPNGIVRAQQVNRNSQVSIGRLGTFGVESLLGQPYGLTYEVTEKELNVIPPRSIEDIEDTEATNELINDGQFVQPLTAVEIEGLKQSGVHATDIIKLQIEAHANYSLKTEYSKDKYKKRKEAKYLKAFTTVEPTLFNVCEYWFNHDQNRIRDLRIDSLSQMLSLSNVHPGGRYIAVDDVSGLLVSGIIDRLGESGRLLTISDTDSPPAYPVLTHMNFPKTIVSSILSSLNWATAEETYTPVALLPDPAQVQIKSEKHKARMNKRKVAHEALDNTRRELFAGGFDGLLVASAYDPSSILDRLVQYLGGSALIVIYSPHMQVLSELQNKMRQNPQYLAPSVTESWLRRYQVLPGRTHPMMSTSGSGGYLLTATKIFDDPTAQSVASHRQKRRKAPVSSVQSPASTSTGAEEPQSAKNDMIDSEVGGELDEQT